MRKPKLSPGIHLHKSHDWKPIKKGDKCQGKPEWYWHIVSRNGRIIARSNPVAPYSSKRAAVKSIKTVAQLFYFQFQDNGFPGYHDHSIPNSSLQSYL